MDCALVGRVTVVSTESGPCRFAADQEAREHVIIGNSGASNTPSSLNIAAVHCRYPFAESDGSRQGIGLSCRDESVS